MSNDIEAKELRALRSQLESRLSTLVEEIRRELEAQKDASYADLSAQVRDLADEATVDVLIDSRLFDIQRDAGELREIRAALGRMSDGSYGTCVECGEPIDIARLRAQPAAVRCMACQRRYEHEHAKLNPREI